MPFKSKAKMRRYLRRWRKAHPTYMREWLRRNPAYYTRRYAMTKIGK